MPFAGLRDMELATQLSNQLSDYEFEILLRERIKSSFADAIRNYPELKDGSHAKCEFIFNWDDACKWSVGMGSTYANAVRYTGEVLSTSLDHVRSLWAMQDRNKLSMLLPAPTPVVVAAIREPDPEQIDDPSLTAAPFTEKFQGFVRR